jgi:hypothetical protein
MERVRQEPAAGVVHRQAGFVAGSFDAEDAHGRAWFGWDVTIHGWRHLRGGASPADFPRRVASGDVRNNAREWAVLHAGVGVVRLRSLRGRRRTKRRGDPGLLLPGHLQFPM